MSPLSVPNPPLSASRRGVIAGAVWTTPAVVLVTAVPAFAAASTTYTLMLSPVTMKIATGGSTSAERTSAPITGSVTAIPSGSSVSNIPVTVSLPAGYTLASGGPTFTTNSSGQFTFQVVAPQNATGTITVTANTDGAHSSAVGTLSVKVAKLTGLLGWAYQGFNQGQVTPTGGDVTTATAMADATSTTDVSAIGGSFAGLLWADQDGMLWGRGYNSLGELGVGTTGNVTSPTRARISSTQTLDKQIVHIARGLRFQRSLVVASDGSVWAAGTADDGFGGNATGAANYVRNNYWQQVGGALRYDGQSLADAGRRVVAAEMGYHGGVLFLLDNGHVLSCGDDNYGATANGTQLGLGWNSGGRLMQTASWIGPDQVANAMTDAAQVALGYGSSGVVTASGELWIAGDVSLTVYGGNGESYLTRATLPPGKSARKVFLNHNSSMWVIMTDGTCYARGYNLYGLLGTGSTGHAGQGFVEVKTNATTSLTDVVDVTSGNDGALFLLGNGDVYFAGANDNGGKGDGTTGGTTNAYAVKVPNISGATRVATHYYDTNYAFV